MKRFSYCAYEFTLEVSGVRDIKVQVFRTSAGGDPKGPGAVLPILELHFSMTDKESLPDFVSRTVKETRGYLDWRGALALEIQKVR